MRGLSVYLWTACLIAVAACGVGGTAQPTPVPDPTPVVSRSSGASGDVDGLTPTTARPTAMRPDRAGAPLATATDPAVAPPSGPEATSAPAETPPPSDAEPAAEPTPAEEPTPTSTPRTERTMYVDTDEYLEANLRAKPTTDSRALRALPYRSEVAAAPEPVRNAEGERWYRVRYRSTVGYMYADLLSAERPTPIPPGVRGVVVSQETGRPVAGAWVYLGDRIERTDGQGRYRFRVPASRQTLTVMAPGYAKFDARAARVAGGRVALRPFDARGVYLPFYSAARSAEVERIFDMIERTTLNAIVIDVKSDEGLVWRSRVPLARSIDASVDYMDLRGFVRRAHERGIYVIGRFTVFKDPRFANARPTLAIRSTEGGLWEDAPGVAYADPFQTAVWEYMGDLAEEAAAQGVDEIQYDYVRFPVDGDLSTARYAEEATDESRPRQINAFVDYMEDRLRPHKVFISADIFGRVVFHPVDPNTGQILEDFVEHVDYVSPMLYPSGFNEGSGGFGIPTQHSYGLIKESLRLTNERLEGKTARARPWLQSFADYAFDEPYGLPQHLEQRRAAEEMDTSGWLFWNPAATYDPRAFVANPD